MTGTTHQTRLPTRMLATAYSNADFWVRRPEFLHDIQILRAAAETGIDTRHWEECHEKARAYACEAYELPPWPDPDTGARRI